MVVLAESTSLSALDELFLIFTPLLGPHLARFHEPPAPGFVGWPGAFELFPLCFLLPSLFLSRLFLSPVCLLVCAGSPPQKILFKDRVVFISGATLFVHSLTAALFPPLRKSSAAHPPVLCDIMYLPHSPGAAYIPPSLTSSLLLPRRYGGPSPLLSAGCGWGGGGALLSPGQRGMFPTIFPRLLTVPSLSFVASFPPSP